MKNRIRGRIFSISVGLVIVAGFAFQTQHSVATATNPNAYQEGAVLWYQTAGEARALYYQAYNLARLRLDQMLDTLSSTVKPAVVVDIDETVLNNSPHQAKLIATGERFPEYWKEWVELAEADPLPGSVSFLTYAASRGVAVFYVSNRDQNELVPTMENLKNKGFPQVEASHLLLKVKESGKEPRRKRIEEQYQILLLCGDNLNDFTDLFERKPSEERNRVVDALQAEFGSRFIVLPNPMYGDWERAALGSLRGLTDGEIETRRLKALKSF